MTLHFDLPYPPSANHYRRWVGARTLISRGGRTFRECVCSLLVAWRVEPLDGPPGGSGNAPAKECPSCHAVIAAAFAACPQCGNFFPPPERQKHEANATEAGTLSDQVADTKHKVLDVLYSLHTKRNAPPHAPKTMRVAYRLGLNHWLSEFICVEHDGYARQKAEAWWKLRSPDPVPETADHAVTLAEAGALCSTHSITVRSVSGERFDRIVGYELGPRPDPVGASDPFAEEEVPF